MRTYYIKTHISPMDDDDLQRNFLHMRKKFWIKHGLYMPEHCRTVFREIPGKISRTIAGKGHTAGYLDWNTHGWKIVVAPMLKYQYWAAHITLLHEMAHLHLRWDVDYGGHDERFSKEIDRLYALGAFRRLI